uniref:Uncharacterized protein n=1 Tax=Glossina palpalis gambiensis TaxID=67801 RepID=A0A1B0BGL5_9MUSC
MSDRKAVIKNADMSEEMQQDAVDCATQALEKYNIEKFLLQSHFLSNHHHHHHHHHHHVYGEKFMSS